MKAAELKRPDLEHTSCVLCDEAWQSPEPPDLPEGYLEAVEYLGSLAEDPHAKVDPDRVAEAQRAIDLREGQAAAYKLDLAAYKATHAHAEKAHTLDEHLALAHANRRSLNCEKCGHQEQATPEGFEALKAHECYAGPKKPAYPPEA